MSAAPPGTPIAAFLDNNRQEIELAMRQTQLMLAQACRTAEASHLSIPEKFKSIREQFGATTPTREETQEDIDQLRSKNALKEQEIPVPRVPVFLLTVAEAQLYLQELLDFIVKSILQVKQTEFRRWPQVVDGGTLIPATEFDLWDSAVEDVLPRQAYFGRNKAFRLGNIGDRLGLALARLLTNLGHDPNRCQ